MGWGCLALTVVGGAYGARALNYLDSGISVVPGQATALSQGGNILAAGEIRVQYGQVVAMNNQSGHFQPPQGSLIVAELILQRQGLLAKDAHIQYFVPD